MKKISALIMLVLLVLSATSYAGESYKVRKILLGTFKMGDNGFGKEGSYGVAWDRIETSHVSVTDSHSIFLLDSMDKRVLHFDADGKKINEINLQDADFSDKSEELGDDGYIPYQLLASVSGNRLYTSGGSSADNWTIYDLSGRPIKKNIHVKGLQRTCTGNFTANGGRQLLNDSLEVIKKGLAPKQRKTANRVLGIDDHGNSYLLIKEGTGIIKRNKDGKESSIITFPSDPFFKDGRYISYQVTCDGTVYAIPPYSVIFWSNGGNKNKSPWSYWLYEFSQR